MIDRLVLKPINELLGEHFYIGDYQRGYRWTKQQVNDLLNDIWAFASKPASKKDAEFYCLQPVVVKHKKWNTSEQNIDGWEVVDGQQRLTTIYIILNYLAKEFLKVDSLTEDFGKDSYSLKYQTRPNSEIFLKNIIEDKSNIDFHHISEAYKTVKEWFTNGDYAKDRTDKNKFLSTLLGKKTDERSVQIIWYMVDQNVESIELFTRLNIGKIPLTNAELIKALFLSSSSFEGDNPNVSITKKIEISQMWDAIEQELSDNDFWSFVTNAKQNDFPTKIELLFDVIANRKDKEIDHLFTFLFFLEKSKDGNNKLWDIWLEIEQCYLTLCEWYKDKNLYHKIGYLISEGEHIRDLIELSKKEKKNEFESILDKNIRKIVNFDIEALSYENTADYKRIEKLLLLFNVESIRANKNISERYPFKFHKGTQWSLEHIHAQNSESLDKTKREPWFKWLGYHQKLIEELINDGDGTDNINNLKMLLDEVINVNNEKLTWEKFNSLSTKIIETFSENSDGGSGDMHSISNLALLSQPDNAALNNSVFEVKRREIIQMDMKGSYIPLCTRRVFLKYYNDKLSAQQLYFWGKNDRDSYLNAIKNVLKNYLPQENLGQS